VSDPSIPDIDRRGGDLLARIAEVPEADPLKPLLTAAAREVERLYLAISQVEAAAASTRIGG